MKMSKLFKKDTKQLINALHKLTDKRFSFDIVHSYNDGIMGYSLETSYCGNFIASCPIQDFDITTVVDCLIDLVNSAELKHDQDYFDKFGISFKIHHCKNLNGISYYTFKKHDGA